MRAGLAALLTVLALGASGSVARAVSLQDLFDGGSITAGGLRFSGWTLNNSYGDVDASSIEVTPDGSDPGNPGIVYSTLDGSPILSEENGQNAYFFFGFSAEVLDPLYGIATDRFTIESGNVIVDDPSDDDSILITENVADSSYGFFAEREIRCGGPGSTTGALDCSGIFETLGFTAQPGINVTTYFEIDGSASLYRYSHHFTQVPSPVPEPSTMLLLGGGLFGLFGLNRLRRP